MVTILWAVGDQLYYRLHTGIFIQKEIRMAARYIVRDEKFGITLYDRNTLRHKFFVHEQVPDVISSIKQSSYNYDWWHVDTRNVRDDIIYSPIRVYYEITLKCNLRCKFCYNDSAFARPNELSTNEVIKSLEQMREANVLDIRFTGGELTQRPDWYILLKKAKELGFAVSCNTNGVYRDKNTYDKFASLDLEQVTLSIDGIGSHHDLHRGQNTYKKTVYALKELHRRGVRLRINTLISRWSLNDLEPMVELASNYVTEINFFAFRFSGRAKLHLDQSVTFEEYYEMGQYAEKIRQKYRHVNIMHFGQAFRENSIHPEKKPIGLKIGAPDGFTRFNIISDGSLWAGGYVPYIDSSWKLGNIKTDNLFNVWQNNVRLDEYRERSLRLKTVCFGCPEYMKRCPGASYEMELFREVNPNTTNPFCAYGDGLPLLSPEVLNQEILPYKQSK